MNPKSVIHSSWKPVMGLLYQEPLLKLNDLILPNCSYNPKPENIFRVFRMPIKDIKIVILGQDPYPDPTHANGLAFATDNKSVKPQSLRVIEREIIETDKENVNSTGTIDLEEWEKQGVFLLNTALTTERGNSGSHLRYWKPFIEKVIKFIAIQNPCIWLLWGRKAQRFETYITKKFFVRGYNKESISEIPISNDYNYIMAAPHPAVEFYGSGDFYGNNHFYYANKILLKKRENTVNW